jgi:hypothetical protein
MATTEATTEVLGTYLNDHLGGAHAGMEMARKLCDRAADGPDAAVLATLVTDIEADRDDLRALIERLAPSGHPVTQAAGWIAGKAHQVAVGEALTGDEHLSMLLQTESLALDIEGKQALWEALLVLGNRCTVRLFCARLWPGCYNPGYGHTVA